MENTLLFSLIVFCTVIYSFYYFNGFLSSSEGLTNTHKMTNLKPNKEFVLLTVFSYVFKAI